MALIISINPTTPQTRLIHQVVAILQKGGVICYPTDTMYGIGCDICNQKAVYKVHQIKQRPKDKPCSFICADLKNISEYAHVNNTAYRLMRKCLPGPFTFVLNGTKLVPKIMLTRQKTVGIRVPDHPIPLALVRELGNPILTTSVTGTGSPTTIRDGIDVAELFGKSVDCIIDGGPISPEPSSVISLIEEQPEILREGKGDIRLFF